MKLPHWLTQVICFHQWSQWEREARTLTGPLGVTGPHYYQIRHYVNCGWQQESTELCSLIDIKLNHTDFYG